MSDSKPRKDDIEIAAEHLDVLMSAQGERFNPRHQYRLIDFDTETAIDFRPVNSETGEVEMRVCYFDYCPSCAKIIQVRCERKYSFTLNERRLSLDVIKKKPSQEP